MPDGTEQGWKEASVDSRRHQKQRDIRQFTDRVIAQQKAAQKEWEDTFENDLVELAEPVVRAGFERKSFGYSRRYAANFTRAFQGE